jgi:hypothetical protein
MGGGERRGPVGLLEVRMASRTPEVGRGNGRASTPGVVMLEDEENNIKDRR